MVAIDGGLARLPDVPPMKRSPHRIAVLLPVEPEYSNRLLEGAIRYSSEHPEVELVEMPYVRRNESPLPEGKLAFTGALLHLNAFDTWVERLLAEDIKVVNTSGEWWERGLPSVAFNGSAVQSLAAEFLVALGRQHLGYVGAATSDSEEFRRRQNLFLKLVADKCLTASGFEIGRVNGIENRITSLPEDAAARLRVFLTGLPKPAALWCEDDYIARLVCDHAGTAGLRVPEDVAVLGLGDYSVARLGNPPISTIPQPGQLVGYKALELLHQVLDGCVVPSLRPVVPPPPVIERESTGSGVLADERFQRIRRWIHEHACEGLTVAELVARQTMSQFTLTKHYERLFGRTPGAEIRAVKVDHARRYLRTTDFSVERIASLCGFEQAGKFSKFFKRETGMTPSEYRRGDINACG
jgi:LacI family transcriptional regulator